MPDHPFNDLLRATAEVLAALAWPMLVFILATRHRPLVDKLLQRVVKMFGVEFTPEPQIQSPAEVSSAFGATPIPGGFFWPDNFPAAADAPSADVAAAIGELERLRTSLVLETEKQILELPIMSNSVPIEEREKAMRTIAARLLIVNNHERVETGIWASQLRMLEHLNSKSDGASQDELKNLFYEPASIAFPDMFKTYPFDEYLNFLTSFGLVKQADQVVVLTELGRDYLFWRIEQKKIAKRYG